MRNGKLFIFEEVFSRCFLSCLHITKASHEMLKRTFREKFKPFSIIFIHVVYLWGWWVASQIISSTSFQVILNSSNLMTKKKSKEQINWSPSQYAFTQHSIFVAAIVASNNCSWLFFLMMDFAPSKSRSCRSTQKGKESTGYKTSHCHCPLCICARWK